MFTDEPAKMPVDEQDAAHRDHKERARRDAYLTSGDEQKTRDNLGQRDRPHPRSADRKAFRFKEKTELLGRAKMDAGGRMRDEKARRCDARKPEDGRQEAAALRD
jgi:hypothetical protein